MADVKTLQRELVRLYRELAALQDQMRSAAKTIESLGDKATAGLCNGWADLLDQIVEGKSDG